MYNKPSAPLASAACLSQVAFACLFLVTVGWVLYLALNPIDPDAPGFAPLFRQMVNYGLGIAWVSSLALSGLLWLLERLTGRPWT